jgi:2-succinyl-5-enolpyruvyl-6-hydroxy-3-cyclohexene-1-carboxylate synthase
MHDQKPANLPTYWSARVVNELYRCGLRYVVISPGSRSTPLTLAFAAHPGIEKIVVLDERAAAFRALGLSRESAHPTALVCTSGTAVSNYLPALTEAAASGIPLIALTADRPPNQRQIGANQTIPQTGLFDAIAVFSCDAGEPVDHETDFRRVEILAAQAYHAAAQLGGASHINFPFRKPLEPESDFFTGLKSWYEQSLVSRQIPQYQKHIGPTQFLPREFWSQLEQARRPVVILGPAYAHTCADILIDYFHRHHIPVLAEAGSCYCSQEGSKHLICGFNTFLRDSGFRRELAPDLIIRLGAMATGKGLELYLQDYRDVPHVLISAARELSNPTLAQITHFSVSPTTELQLEHVTQSPLSTEWKRSWVRLSDEFVRKRSAYFQQKSDPEIARQSQPIAKEASFNATSALTDADVHQLLSEVLRPDHRLMVSNSFPARDADTFAMPHLATLRTHMNRGASGIDGISSTAAGIALACAKPTWLITGDLAFFHDLSSLLNLNREPINLTIVIINNTGGTIFRMLPVYEPGDWYTKYFETPQLADVGPICAGLGLQYHQVRTRADLEATLSGLNIHNFGVRVIECVTDAEASMIERNFVNRMFPGL